MRKEKAIQRAGWGHRHKVFVVLLAAVMIMEGLFPFTGAGSRKNAYAADVETKSFELDITDNMIYYGDWFTRVMYFKFTDTGERERSYCMNPELVPPTEGVHKAKIYNYKNVPDEYKPLWKALYYLEGGEGYSQVADVWSSVYDYDPSDDSWTYGHEQAYALSHMVVSDLSPSGSSGDMNAGEEYIRLKNAMIKRIEKMPDPPKRFQIAVYISSSGMQNLSGYCAPLSLSGSVEVRKKPAEEDVPDNDAYSLAGAVYSVYKDADLDKKVGQLVTDKNGHTDPLTLEEGTYYVKETKASKGYKLDEKTYKVKVEADDTAVVTSHEKPEKGKLKLIKYSVAPEWTRHNALYSLKGARYAIYRHQNNGSLSGKVGELITDENGYAVDTLELYAGTYYVKEIEASKGFEINPTVYSVTVRPGDTTTLESKEEPDKGILELVKESGAPEWTDDNDHYSLADAEYTVYRRYEDGKLSGKSGVLTTDRHGHTKEPLKLYAGTYYVKETKPSKGFEMDPKVYTVKVSAGETETVRSIEKPKKGLLEVQKYSDVPEWTDHNDQYSLEDAEYTVYKAMENGTPDGKVGVLITDSKGHSKTPLELYAGTYYVKETKAPRGFEADPKIYTAEVKVDNTSSEPVRTTVQSTDKAKKGMLKLRKDSSNPGITEDNGCYFLRDAEYGVYRTKKDAESGQNRLEILKTDGKGVSNVVKLYGGDYYVKELKAPVGYTIDQSLYKIRVIIDEESMVASHEEPKYGPVELALEKVDQETGEKVPQGGATLEGAVFAVQYYDGYYDTPEQAEKAGNPLRTWIMKTDAKGEIKLDEAHFVEGDAYYYNLKNEPVLPLGTVSFKELVAPKGYKLNSDTYLSKVTDDGSTGPSVMTYKTPVIPDLIKRGDLKGVKIFDNTAYRGSHVVFRLTSVTTGESHILAADQNGRFDTSAKWAMRDEKTNANDATLDEKGTIQEELLDDEAGIWFAGTATGSGVKGAAADPDKGALPYDEYVLDELATTANKGHHLLEGIHIMVRYDVMDQPLRGLVELGTLTDDEKVPPELKTTAVDQTTELHIGNADETVTILDTVTYSGLKPGCEYTVRGTLMDKQTGFPVLDQGRPVTAEVTFIARKKEGTVEVPVTLSGSAVKGKTVVVFETLCENDVEIASHRDLEDEDQTVVYPEIGTRADIAGKKQGTMIIDTVYYNGLIPGHTYYMKAALYNPADRNLVDGKEATVKFVPETSRGHIEMEIDAAGLEGETVVVYETCTTAKGIIVGEHCDPQSKEQTVTFEKPDKPDKPEKPVTPDKPEKPVTPDKPEKPDTPDKPDKPVVPDKPVAPVKPHVPRTGDQSHSGMATGIFMISAAAAAATLLFARRREDKPVR